MSGKILSFEFFPTLHNKEEYFQKIIDRKGAGKRILGQYIMICLFSFLYGLVVGSYHSFIQAVAAGAKIMVLFTLALLICFPAFFIIQYILGSKLKLSQMVSIILSGFVLMTAIMISFAPIVIIFLLTGSNYYFLQLLHIAIFFLSGIFGMMTIIEALKYSCETKSIYPQTGVVVFRFWVVILAFVGIQLAWNFRPFLGDRGQPFELFRHYEGNFYTALIYSAEQLMGGRDKEPANKKADSQIYNTGEDKVNDSLMRAIFEDKQGGK
ncbi:MAG: hypothetical protein AB1746_17550 [Candidatus Zixiibacteriota bacterium]